tara:strand:- start:2606 stop:2875 length:270 start_codon:yes stop_codon:yes gene_type:complete
MIAENAIKNRLLIVIGLHNSARGNRLDSLVKLYRKRLNRGQIFTLRVSMLILSITEKEIYTIIYQLHSLFTNSRNSTIKSEHTIKIAHA